MAGTPSLLQRWWRMHARRNRLTRPCDRAESALVMITVLVALVAVPFVAAAGSETAARGIERAQQEMNSRYSSVAVTLEHAPAPMVSVGRPPVRPVQTLVPATWTAPDGTSRLGRVPVTPGMPAGTRQPIWVDDDGNLTPPPSRHVEAISAGVQNGVSIWLAVLVPLTSFCWLAHLILNRFRYAQWSREWEHLGRNSSHS